MDKYLKYQEEQINEFLNNSLAIKLFDLVRQNEYFKIDIKSGPIHEKKNIIYCFGVSLKDIEGNDVYVFDDGYLTAYAELIRRKKIRPIIVHGMTLIL